MKIKGVKKLITKMTRRVEGQTIAINAIANTLTEFQNKGFEVRKTSDWVSCQRCQLKVSLEFRDDRETVTHYVGRLGFFWFDGHWLCADCRDRIGTHSPDNLGAATPTAQAVKDLIERTDLGHLVRLPFEAVVKLIDNHNGQRPPP